MLKLQNNMKNREIIKLLETIGYPEDGDLSYRAPQESEDALEIARANKIDSLYLQ